MCETCVPILREITAKWFASRIMTAKCMNCGRDMCADEVNAYMNELATEVEFLRSALTVKDSILAMAVGQIEKLRAENTKFETWSTSAWEETDND